MISIELFSVFAKLALDMEEFEKGLDKAAESMEKFIKGIDVAADTVCEIMNGMTMAINVAEEIGDNLNQTMEYISEFVEATNEKAEAVQEFAETAVESMGKAGKAIEELSTAFVTGGDRIGNIATRLEEIFMEFVKRGLDIYKITQFAAAIANLWTRLGGLAGILNAVKSAFAALWPTIKAVGQAILAVIGWKGVLAAAIVGLIGYIVYLATRTRETIERCGYAWKKLKESIEYYIDLMEASIQLFIAILKRDWEEAFERAMEIVSVFMKFLPGEMAEMVYIGKNAIRGFVEGFTSMRDSVRSTISRFFNDNVLGVARQILGINLPSRVFADEVGKMIVAGVAKGIDDEASTAEESAIKMAQGMLEPQKQMFELSFWEIAEIVVRALEQMAQKAMQVIRALTARMDARLNSDGFRIGQNFFRALGDGLIAEEAALLSRANWVADAIRRAFASEFGVPSQAAVRAAESWAANHPQYAMMAMLESAVPAVQSVTVNQNFYGVREEKMAYQAYRAAQRVYVALCV